MGLDESHILLAGLRKLVADIRKLLAELRKLRHVCIAVIVELVGDDTVETLIHVLKLVKKLCIHFRSEREPVEKLLGTNLRLFDSHAYLHLLLTRKKRNLPHLVQIHADGILDRIAVLAKVGRVLLILVRTVCLNIVRTDDINVERLKNHKILIGGGFILDRLRDDRVQLLVRDIAAVLLRDLLYFLDDRIALFGAKHASPLEVGHYIDALRIVLVGVGHRRRSHGNRSCELQFLLCIGIGAIAISQLLVFNAVGLLRHLLQVKTARLSLLGLHAFIQHWLIGRIPFIRHVGNQTDVLIVFLQP